MSELQLNVRVVRNVLDTAKRKPELDRKSTQRVLEACHRSLRAHASGQLKLDPAVRTPLKVVVSRIWEVRRHAVSLLRKYQSPYSD